MTTFVSAQADAFRVGLLQYRGGGDWYANPTSLPNLIDFVNAELGTDMEVEAVEVEVGSAELFNLPMVHMTGHGNVVFNAQEAENLRTYLLAGGFLHIDDNYGMDPFVRKAVQSVFPDAELVELPFSHPVFQEPFAFAGGLPKIHEHDGKPPQAFGIFHEERLVVLYTYESDLGDGWEDPSVHNDPEDVRHKALQMGANILHYALTN